MGCMAYIALFYFLVIESALKGDKQSFDVSLNHTEESLSYRSLKPLRPPIRLSKFFLFTPKAFERSLTLDIRNRDSLSDFNPSLDTKIIIHGFLDSVSIASWIHDMKDEILMYGDYNVIVVDWSSGNSMPYSRAAANTETVANEISDLLKVLLNKYGAKPETFHLIGHSLGSHVAGFVGKSISGIGRITGLDPASPAFENEDPSHRLHHSDAAFVDVIHTDAGDIGIVKPTGHQDFFPNNGRDQPGCTASNSLRVLINEGVIEGIRNLVCSHMRAPLYFTASINCRDCQMIGVLCNSWQDFKDGKCIDCGNSGERCAVMGFHADVRRGNRNKLEPYYLMTRSKEPYCAYEYKISFDVEDNRNSAQRGLFRLRLDDLPIVGSKTLELTIRGSQGLSEFCLDDSGLNSLVIAGACNHLSFPEGSWFVRYGRFHNSFKYVTHVVASKIYLGTVRDAVAKWKPLKSTRVLSAVTGQRLTIPQIRRIKITPMKELSQPNGHQPVFVLCSRETSIGFNKEITFSRNYC